MASTGSSALAMRATSHGSSKTIKQRDTPSAGADFESPTTFHGNGPARDSARQRGSDLSCVGAWTAQDQAQAQTNGFTFLQAHPNTFQHPCSRHSSLRKACLYSTHHEQVALLLKGLHSIDPADGIVGLQAGGAPVAVCTCEVWIEVDSVVDEGESKRAVPIVTGTGGHERLSNGTD